MRRILTYVFFTTVVAAPVAAQQIPSERSRLEEVIVVAQKREGVLQDTPIAITMLSNEDIVFEGITDLREAQMHVPGVRFQAEGNNTQVFIRGVGSNLDFANVEASVGFILNGLYIPREGTSAAFFDLAQLEVLPGPQGTLYGRSSVGGNVVASFNRPDRNSDGSLLLEAGNLDMFHVSYAQNLALTDTLAVRAAVDYITDDGINETGAGAKNDIGLRLSGLYQPSESLEIFIWGQWVDKDGHPQNLVNKGLDPATFTYDEDKFLRSDPWDDTRTGALAELAPFGQPRADRQKYESIIIGAQIDWQLGDYLLTYIPGYFELDSDPVYWIGAIPANLPAEFEQQSHELRLSATTEKLQWLAGLYLYRVENSGNLQLFTDTEIAFLQTNIEKNEINNAAVFGELIYSLGERTRVTVGGRASYDERKANGLAPDPLGRTPWEYEKDYSNFDWKFGIDHDLLDDVLTYAAIQTGFKPGTYNEVPDSTEIPADVDSTELLAYILGFKSTLLEGGMNLNLELFYYDYQDLAIQAYDVDADFNPQFNADKVEIYGAQFDMDWLILENGRLNVNVGYTHARNESFVTPAGDDFSGLQTPYSPDWTNLVGYQHNFSLLDGEVVWRIQTRYESSWYADYVQNPGVKQQHAWKADSSITYESNNDWSLGAWVKNITDEPVIAATAAAGIPGPATAYLEAPRTYGLRLTYNF